MARDNRNIRLIRATPRGPGAPPAAPFYLDNAASGANDGTSWADAWESFADIVWGPGGLTGGKTLYISGGAVSKTYNETLTIGAGGNPGNLITIDIGANSPSPAGHDGIVIIDGGALRHFGIMGGASACYIHISGWGTGDYKLLIQNILPDPAGGNFGIDFYNGNHIYLDYIKIVEANVYGIQLYTVTDSRIRGCYIDTEVVNGANLRLVGIYLQGGSNNVVENNVSLQQGTMDLPIHSDAIQFLSETNLICRNNYMAWAVGAGNDDCGTLMSSNMHGYFYFYNNILVGNSLNPYNVFQSTNFTDGQLYQWNNTILSQEPTIGDVVNLQIAAAGIGEIKNNIFISTNGHCLLIPNSVTPVTKIDYNCLYTGGLQPAEISGVGGRTWAQWQAAGYDANGINVDPDYDSADEYRLKITSDCIDAGADLSAYFTIDRDGTLRPVGAWDIGAYEYH